MKAVRLECDNGDSCTPGTSHLYPAVGEDVTLLFAQELHVRGRADDVDFAAGSTFRVVEIDPEGHHVVCADPTRDGLFYVPIDDLDWPADRAEIEEEGEEG